jgi:hypothetical protein
MTQLGHWLAYPPHQRRAALAAAATVMMIVLVVCILGWLTPSAEGQRRH